MRNRVEFADEELGSQRGRMRGARRRRICVDTWKPRRAASQVSGGLFMTMRTAIVSGLALAMLGYPAAASTAGAWNQHHIQVRAACIAASDLVEAKALDYTAFDDSIGYDVERRVVERL